MNWDKRFIDLASHIGNWSKDPKQKVGAVVVDSSKNILSVGYNGFPRGVSDTNTRLTEKEVKLAFVVHAEQNCIYNAGRNGVSLNGATMYITPLPVCSECAKGIIQAGIHRVCLSSFAMDNASEKWKQSWNLSQIMFDEAGVSISYV